MWGSGRDGPGWRQGLLQIVSLHVDCAVTNNSKVHNLPALIK